MGTLQLVSGNTSMGRGALGGTGANMWLMTITFLPEPGATALLASGLLGLLVLHRRARR